MLARFNPFRTLPNPRAVWAWGMYDLANQSFQLLINTLLFGIFLKNVVAPSPSIGAQAWGLMIASATLLTVLLSVPLGALADARAWKRELLIATGLVASTLTIAMASLQPGWLWVAAALYISAATCVGLGENFLGSFLPELAPPERMGRVSAIGWTMSYVGALLLLALTAVAVYVLGLEDPARWRWLFVGAGVWFILGMLPAVVILHERAAPRADRARRGMLTDAFRRLRESWRESARFRQLRRFLLAGFIYGMGVNTIIYYAAIIGDSLGFGIRQLTLLAGVMALTAGCGAVFAARRQDRLGHRRTLLIFLAIWTLSTLALAATAALGLDGRLFWFISAGLGLGLGGIGTGSRALVGAFTPLHHSGEFFGMWGFVYKLSAVVGPAGFALASRFAGQTASLLILAGFFVGGAALLMRVDEQQGMAAAKADVAPV